MTQETDDPNKFCCWCGEDVAPRRWGLGYRTCLWCGEEEARQSRATWTVAPIHKGNYMLITNPEDLHGLNNKGGLVR